MVGKTNQKRARLRDDQVEKHSFRIVYIFQDIYLVALVNSKEEIAASYSSSVYFSPPPPPPPAFQALETCSLSEWGRDGLF